MAIVITSNSGKKHYALAHYVCDSNSDIQDLPIEQVWVGSTAFIISTGETYMFNSEKEWVKIKVDGSAGEPGRAATIQVGEVVTGAPGSPVTIVNHGSENAALLDFSIPRGEPFQIKKVYDTYEEMNSDYHGTDVNVGEIVAVTNPQQEKELWIKTNTEYEYFTKLENATVIKGEDGAPGEKGDKGDKGDPFIYADFTEDQLAALKGADGAAGQDGDDGRGILSITASGSTATIAYDDGTSELITLPAGEAGEGITNIKQNLDGTITITVGESTEYTVEALQGETGNGIDNVVDLGDGDVKIIMDDGTEYTVSIPAGPQGATGATGATGPQGPKGDPVAFKEVYDTTQDMEDDYDNPDILVGDIVIVKDGKVYIKTTTDWTYLFDITTTETIEGPEGPQGPKGDEGDEGPGISNIALDNSGKLIISIDNGDSYTIDFNDIWMRKVNPVGSGSMSMNRKASTGIGAYSATFGYNCEASGPYSFAEGNGTKAISQSAHAEGIGTQAIGMASHTEGSMTKASGTNSHAEGENTQATKIDAHAEGHNTQAIGNNAHAEGNNTIASGTSSHAEGDSNSASGVASHAEGTGNFANGNCSHTEGTGNVASNLNAHAEGKFTQATGEEGHSEGMNTKAIGSYSHAEGCGTTARSNSAHAEG